METTVEINFLEQLIDLLQSCCSVEEVDAALKPLMQQLFPNEVGAIYVMSSSKNLVEAIATWGPLPLTSDPIFTPTECLALRREQAHMVEDIHHGLLCQHIRSDSSGVETLCVPMMAHGETLGIFYVGSLHRGGIAPIKPLAVSVAKYISLALANLKLRDTLNHLRLRDPLTTLYNRRYLEQSLEREIQRSGRQKLPVGVILLHIDRFEHFHDQLGYAASDCLLREIGMFLSRQIRASDMACRYRGKEFLLVLPEASLETTQQQAETLRQNIKQLNIEYNHQTFGAITISCGVASFSEHGLTSKAVLRAADAAMKLAQEQGCDRIVTLPTTEALIEQS
ncbi:MAG: sensor domain-containing diguanylate cyclase [Cyanobacteriota bacterium]